MFGVERASLLMRALQVVLGRCCGAGGVIGENARDRGLALFCGWRMGAVGIGREMWGRRCGFG